MDLVAVETSLKLAIGKQRTVDDVVSPSIVERLSVTLDSSVVTPRTGDPLPPGWHTVFCLQAPARGSLGADGLPASFDQIPPIQMQRRMFGGARLTFHRPLIVGEMIQCESAVSDVKVRTSPSSHMAIVTLRHSYSGASGIAVTEEQDIIYLEPLGIEGEKPASVPAPMPVPTSVRHVTPDPIMLFRFSALTFNSHRIHYDAPYSVEVEKLPGLMVQGKLIALQLLETVRASAPAAQPQSFEYRSGRALFANAAFSLSVSLDATGRAARLWASDAKGRTVQNASMIFAKPVVN